jgi:alpha-amylase
VRKIGAQGFRFDAIKHIDESFISKFVSNAREKSGYPKLFSVGEYWKDSIDDLDTYLAQFGTQFSVFDTPLHYNFKRAGEAGNSYDMRQIFDNTVVQKRPIDAVTLVDNHDTQVGQALESCVPSWFKPLAYSLILLRPDGYP